MQAGTQINARTRIKTRQRIMFSEDKACASVDNIIAFTLL